MSNKNVEPKVTPISNELALEVVQNGDLFVSQEVPADATMANGKKLDTITDNLFIYKGKYYRILTTPTGRDDGSINVIRHHSMLVEGMNEFIEASIEEEMKEEEEISRLTLLN